MILFGSGWAMGADSIGRQSAVRSRQWAVGSGETPLLTVPSPRTGGVRAVRGEGQGEGQFLAPWVAPHPSPLPRAHPHPLPRGERGLLGGPLLPTADCELPTALQLLADELLHARAVRR